METTRIEQANTHGKTKTTLFRLKGDTLYREWGIQGGAMQKTEHTYAAINVGKKNELNPTQAARADYDRIIKKKCKEGYHITESTTHEVWNEATTKTDEIALSHLPTAFCCSKPTAKPSVKKINKALQEGKAKITVKHNGLCHYILINQETNVKIYTRRVDDHTKKYPEIVKFVESCVYPAGTVLIAEFTVSPEDSNMPHLEAFRLMSQISKVDTLKGKLKPDQSESLCRQKENSVRACIFGVLYNGFDPVWSQMTQGEIEEKFLQFLPDVSENKPLFKPIVPANVNTLDQAKEYIKNAGDSLEGLVIWMLDEKMEVTFNGKPKRRCSYKLKVSKEIDVVAWGWANGNGDRQGKIGALKLGEYLADGTWRDLGTVGSGLRDDQADPELWDFPCVVEIAYDNRFPDSMRFQFPRFIKVHEDKTVEDMQR